MDSTNQRVSVPTEKRRTIRWINPESVEARDELINSGKVVSDTDRWLIGVEVE